MNLASASMENSLNVVLSYSKEGGKDICWFISKIAFRNYILHQSPSHKKLYHMKCQSILSL